MMERKCEVCFSKEKTMLYTQHFNNTTISLMDNYDVVVCDRCGFIFADNIPSQEEFNKYYAEQSQYEFQNRDGKVPQSYIDHNQKLIDFMSPHIEHNKNMSILEVGCSTGQLLKQLKDLGFTNLMGVDPSSYCINIVKEKYDIEAIISDIASLELNKKYDLIILSAVIEHLVDLHDSIEKVLSMLNPEGYLFVEIPDASRFENCISTPFQQFSIEHIQYFTGESICNLLKKFTYDCIDMQRNYNTINQTIDPNLLLMFMNVDKGADYTIDYYIDKCKNKDLIIKKRIKDILLNFPKIIVWGVGTPTQRLLGDPLNYDQILYFVDSNVKYAGKKINGIEIKLPSDIKDSVPILVSSYSHRDAIIKQIKDDLHLENEIVEVFLEEENE